MDLLLVSPSVLVTLAAASVGERRLGQTGRRILTRLMGLALCAIAVRFIGDGIRLTGLAGAAQS